MEGGHRPIPMLGSSGTVVRVWCGPAQGEEAQHPQEVLAPADINSTGRGHSNTANLSRPNRMMTPPGRIGIELLKR